MPGGNQVVDGNFETLTAPSSGYLHGTFSGNWGGAYGTSPIFPAQIDPASPWYSNAYAGIKLGNATIRSHAGNNMAIVRTGSGILWQSINVDTTGYYQLSYYASVGGGSSGNLLYPMTLYGAIHSIIGGITNGMPAWAPIASTLRPIDGGTGYGIGAFVIGGVQTPVLSASNSSYVLYTTRSTNPVLLYAGYSYLLMMYATPASQNNPSFVYFDDISLVCAPFVTPVAVQTAVSNTPKSFNIGTLSDPNAGPWTVTIVWGDGSSNTVFSQNSLGALPNQTHTYTAIRTYVPSVTATNTSTSLASFGVNFTVTVSS